MDDREQTTIRLPRELKDKLLMEAEKLGISLNALITDIVEKRINHQ